MESGEIIVGLDIGSTKIAAIVGRQNAYGKLEILGYGKAKSLGVKRGVVSNIEYTVDSIRKAVADAEAQAGVNIRVVNVGIAGQHIKSIQHRGSLIRDSLDNEIHQDDINRLVEDMYKLVMQPGEEIIHVIPQSYIVDKESGIRHPIGMAGICLEADFHIITGQVSAVRNINKCVTKAGLQIADQILEPLASAEAVLSDEEKEAGVVLVDIGGGTTDIAIFQDDIIRHTAVIPLGGDIITEDVKEGCTIIKDQAEALKVRFGSALASESKAEEIVSIPGLKGRPRKEISVKNLASIIQARMEEILEHVYYEVKNSGFEKKLIAGLVLTGGGSQLKHISQLAEFITGMDTRIGYPTEHLAEKTAEEMSLPMYATGIGLVLRGQQHSNRNNAAKDKNAPTAPSRTKGSFFDSIFKKGKEFFGEEDVN
jgi:cell division protein FtsA